MGAGQSKCLGPFYVKSPDKSIRKRYLSLSCWEAVSSKEVLTVHRNLFHMEPLRSHMVVHVCYPSRRLKQEDDKFKASLSYIVISGHKK